MLDDLLKIRTTDELDNHVSNYMKKVTDICNSCFRKGPLSYKPTIRWLTDTLRIERNKVAASYKRYKNYPTNANLHDIYKTYRNNYKKHIKEAK